MSQQGLEQFGAYKKARELFDLVTRETRGRYERMKQWLPEEVIKSRVDLLDEIIGILTSSIVRMRKTAKG